MPEIIRCADPSEVAFAAKDLFFRQARKQLATNQYFSVAISGGSTPLVLFHLLGDSVKEFDDWKRVNFFWVDERWVPASDPENNFGNAMQAGLGKIPANFFPYDTGSPSPDAACQAYAQCLKEHAPRFDLVLLGAGSDGHTASIFQEDVTAASGNDLVFPTRHPDTGQTRLTISFALIYGAEKSVLLLTGEEKRPILDALLSMRKPHYPIEIALAGSRYPSIITDIH